jgi:TRAP-type mannitol/chloroaromatic compound transport system permease small subunit
MKLSDKVSCIYDALISFLAQWASTLFIGVMLIVSFEVFMRYAMGDPQTWVVETAEYSLLFIAFLGAAYLLKNEWHIKIEMVLSHLSKRRQAMLNAGTSIIGAAICLTFTIYGSQTFWLCVEMGRRTRGAMLTLQWPLIIVMPVGFLLLFIQFLRRSQFYYKEWKAMANK